MNLEKEIPSVDPTKAGFVMVEDSAYLADFRMFNLAIVDENGFEHDIFNVEPKRQSRFDNGVCEYDEYLDGANAERQAKLDEMRDFYTNACIAAERLETPRQKAVRKAAKAQGIKLEQDDLELHTAPASYDIPSFFDEDEVDAPA